MSNSFVLMRFSKSYAKMTSRKTGYGGFDNTILFYCQTLYSPIYLYTNITRNEQGPHLGTPVIFKVHLGVFGSILDSKVIVTFYWFGSILDSKVMVTYGYG